MAAVRRGLEGLGLVLVLVLFCDAGWPVLCFHWHARWPCALYALLVGVLGFAAGIRDLLLLCAGICELLARFTRRPCAGRHLLFFAAAKKSRQKKAAHTANS
jgi:hypothetical protein